MKVPQVINQVRDTVIAINGESVINDTTQVPLVVPGGITVDVDMFDLKQNLVTVIEDITLNGDKLASSGFYYINRVDLDPALVDRTAFVARVKEEGATYNMRDFKIEDFAVDNDSFESVWMRLPYQVSIGATSWIEWHTDETFSNIEFKAKAYEGGTGTVYATLPERVTHRGPVIVGP